MERKYELDPDTIECPVCKELLCSPVHQCRNGHIACAACSEKLKEKACPSCRSKPFAYSRCLAVESIMESLRVSCRYASQGCKEKVKFGKNEEHEEVLCGYRPIQCPVPKCMREYLHVQIPEHFTSHVPPEQIVQLDPLSSSVQFRMAEFKAPFVLVKSGEGLVLVHHLTRKLVPGDLFFCTSFGRYSESYRLKVKVCQGSSSFSMETTALNNQEQEETWLKSDFLLVPNVGGSKNRQFDLELTLH